MNFVSSHPAFNDTIDSLRNEFKDDTTNDVIVCGAHDFSRSQSIDALKKKYSRVIVFNQEPLTATQRQFMHKGYFTWLKQADEVWDYDEQNIEVLKLIRPDVKLHILKPYKDCSLSLLILVPLGTLSRNIPAFKPELVHLEFLLGI